MLLLHFVGEARKAPQLNNVPKVTQPISEEPKFQSACPALEPVFFFIPPSFSPKEGKGFWAKLADTTGRLFPVWGLSSSLRVDYFHSCLQAFLLSPPHQDFT